MSISRRSLKGVTIYSPEKAYEGYTLFAPLEENTVWLIDMKGNFVHNWEFPYVPACYGKLLPNGNLLYAGKDIDPPVPFGGIGGHLIEMNWDGEVVWEYKDPYMHHDFSRLPNGNTMVLRFYKVPPEFHDKIKGGVPGTPKDGVIWGDSFREITPEGEVVWEWLGHEHLLEIDDFVACPICSREEWTHVNTCHVLPNGDILTSFLRQHKVAIIDKQTKKVKWIWGGDGKLGHQHDPNMLENGNVLIYDNGTHRYDAVAPETFSMGMINFSRVVEVNPESGKIVWEFKDENSLHFHSPFISGSQRLPNGNTLICEGGMGRLFEVTPEKEIVWEYVYPFYVEKKISFAGISNAIFRAYRYSADHPALKGKDLNPRKVELTLREAPFWREKLEREEKAMKSMEEAKKGGANNKALDRLKNLGY